MSKLELLLLCSQFSLIILSITVTLEWWNDLWLNEGFASYVEFKGVHYVHPDWDMVSS